MFLEDVKPDSTHYMLRWINSWKTEVHAHRYVGGERHVVGCVFVGTEHACNKYILAKETVAPPAHVRVAESKLADLFTRSLEQVRLP